MKGKSSPRALNRKRKTVLATLEAQLMYGLKPFRNEKGIVVGVPLEAHDITRIKKEISTLESRVMSDEVAAGSRSKKIASERKRRGSYN